MHGGSPIPQNALETLFASLLAASPPLASLRFASAWSNAGRPKLCPARPWAVGPWQGRCGSGGVVPGFRPMNPCRSSVLGVRRSRWARGERRTSPGGVGKDVTLWFHLLREINQLWQSVRPSVFTTLRSSPIFEGKKLFGAGRRSVGHLETFGAWAFGEEVPTAPALSVHAHSLGKPLSNL